MSSTIKQASLSETHVAITYAVASGAKRIELDAADALELVDVYQLVQGQTSFEAFKQALHRARKAEKALADLRMQLAGQRLLKAVESGEAAL